MTFTDEGLVPYLEGLGTTAGERVYPAVLPQDPTLPAITYQTVSSIPELAQDGAVNLTLARYQITCWAATALAAKQLRESITNNAHGYQGSMGSLTAQLCRAVLVQDEQYEADTGWYWSVVDLQIYHKVTEAT